MNHATTRLLARVCIALVAVLLVAGPASAKGKPERAGKGKKPAVTKQQHGKAVRIAAKCPIEGKAHGQLVKSIARNKAATVEDATAACEAALALQEGDELEDGLEDELEDELEDPATP